MGKQSLFYLQKSLIPHPFFAIQLPGLGVFIQPLGRSSIKLKMRFGSLGVEKLV